MVVKSLPILAVFLCLGGVVYAANAMQSYVLGESIKPEIIRADRSAMPFAGPADVTFSSEKYLYRATVSSPPLFQLWIENAASKAAETCLLHFGVGGGPPVHVEIYDADQNHVLHKLPEIYPIQGEKIPFEKFLLQPKSLVLIRQWLISDPEPLPSGAQAHWSVWINGEYKSGNSSLE